MNRRGWLQLALALSVALNLLAAGIWMGRWMHRPPPMDWAVQPLDETTRGKLRDLLEVRADHTREARRAMRERQRRLRQLLADDSLDEAALTAELAALRAAGGRYQEAMHETAVSILVELEPEQRRRVARQLLAPYPARPDRPDGPPRR
jgi:Spy/CpxP family protein refolding chaperone